MPTKKIIFVYNADSGLLNLCKDALHKWFSPATYPCKLCDLTYGNFGENRDWRIFYKSLSIPSEFLHKDEFEKHYVDFGSKALPAVFIDIDNDLVELISKNTLNNLQDIKQFERLIVREIDRFLLPIH